MKFKYTLLVVFGLSFFTSHSFAQETLSAEQLQIDRQKANQGDVKMQEALGEVYQFGKYGIEKDPFEAKDWYDKAAKQGDIGAIVNLGNMYLNGDNIPQDYIKAKELYEKAANQGNSQAQYNLGNMYRQGQGITKNNFKALEWYQKAASQGDAPSLNNIGILYAKGGDGITKNLIKAKEYFKQACLHRSKNGCENYKRLNK